MRVSKLNSLQSFSWPNSGTAQMAAMNPLQLYILCAVEADGEKEAVANAEPGAADILRNMPRRDVAVRAAGAKSDAKWSIEKFARAEKSPGALWPGDDPGSLGINARAGPVNSRRSHGRAVGRPNVRLARSTELGCAAQPIDGKTGPVSSQACVIF
jgi:hypothetical protein